MRVYRQLLHRWFWGGLGFAAVGVVVFGLGYVAASPDWMFFGILGIAFGQIALLAAVIAKAVEVGVRLANDES